MTVSFSEYDILNRNPGFFVEFDASKATSGLVVGAEALMIGQQTSAGTALEGSVNLVTSVDQAKLLFGVGSQLADMVSFFNANNSRIELRCIPLDDSGVAGEKTITVSGSATEAGTLAIYIGGRRIVVVIASGDSVTVTAAAIAAAITANTDLLYSATALVGVVTLVAKNAGEWTETIPVQINPFTAARGGAEKNPAGTSFVIASSVTGSANPDLAIAIAAIPDSVFNFFIQPYTDNTNMGLWDTELIRRQGAMVQFEGHGFNARPGSVGALTTYGNGRNGKFNTSIDAGLSDFMPDHACTSMYAGRGSFIASNDPAVPWNGNVQGKLVGWIPDFEENRRTFDERNILLKNGVATHEVAKDGTVFVGREITNFQTNSLSQPDVSFLDSQTPLTLSFIRQSFLARMTSAFGQGYKLADDGANITAGQKVATPAIIRAEIVAWASLLVSENIIENLDQFEEDLVVERDGTDVNRVNVVLFSNLVHQFRILAGKITFSL